jgi:molybdopterin synthase sulfur carrier subunit
MSGLRMVYFAWVRERIGTADEIVNPPSDVTTVKSLIDWLITQSPGHAAALGDMRAIRMAVNQEHATGDAPIKPGDEIALFPPVTGG